MFSLCQSNFLYFDFCKIEKNKTPVKTLIKYNRFRNCASLGGTFWAASWTIWTKLQQERSKTIAPRSIHRVLLHQLLVIKSICLARYSFCCPHSSLFMFVLPCPNFEFFVHFSFFPTHLCVGTVVSSLSICCLLCVTTTRMPALHCRI